MKKQCETCSMYMRTPSILGGTAECLAGVKPLNNFIPNEACKSYKYTDFDKLKSQNDFYKEHLGGAIKITKNGLE